MKKLFNYLDYREYLKHYYQEQKTSNTVFSYRYFAEKCEFKAPNFLQWLIEGKRNLTKESIFRVSRAIGHDSKEADYFENLVFFNQAKTINEKKHYFEKLAAVRKQINLKKMDTDQFEYYSQWYNSAIRELLSFHKFRDDYKKLAKSLSPQISEAQARKSIQLLEKLGLVAKDEGGDLRPKDAAITTGDEIQSFLVQNYHRALIALAGESQDRHSRDERDISSLTMSLSSDCFELLKSEIQSFRKHLIEVIKADQNPDRVYQLNLQFFPLTQKNGHAK